MSAHRILGLKSVPRGTAVRRLKRYASWVQNVVRQFGPLSSVGAGELRRSTPQYERTGADGPLVSRLSTNGTAG